MCLFGISLSSALSPDAPSEVIANQEGSDTGSVLLIQFPVQLADKNLSK